MKTHSSWIPLAAAAAGFSVFACGSSSDSAANDSAGTGNDSSAASVDSNASAAAEPDVAAEPDAAPQADVVAADDGPPPEPPDDTDAVFSDDFESGASQWNVVQGSCSITEAATNVLTCTNGGNEARAVAGSPGWTDVTVTANVKLRQMDDGRRVYLAARYTDSNNWYGAAIYNSGTHKVQIRKKVEGSSVDIAEANFPFALDTWYTLQLKISGTTLTLSVDGVTLAEGDDPDFESGSVALLVDRSQVSWDNVVVTTP